MARRRKTKQLPLWLAVIIVIIAFGVYFYYIKNLKGDISDDGKDGVDTPAAFNEMPSPGSGNLNIYFLDVGQGDCMIIVFPDNKTMIVDSGNQLKENEEKIKEFATMLKITAFDYMLLTHADADHVANMDFVFANYQVNHVFRPNVLSTHSDADELNDGINVGFTNAQGGNVKSAKAYLNFLLALQNEPDCTNEIFNKDSDFSGSYTDENGKVHEYVFDFLTPVALPSEIKYSDANDYSPIVTITYNDTVVLLTGDAETEMENEFVAEYKGRYPDCDILKIGHHGSKTSSQQNFLNAVKPEYAIIQCGIDNEYNHPRQAVLDRLKGIGADVYRNDTNGDIAISITFEDTYEFSNKYIYCTNTDISKNLIGGDTELN